MAHMHYPMLELIMLCKMYVIFESLHKIVKWIKPKLELEIAHGGVGGAGRRGVVDAPPHIP